MHSRPPPPNYPAIDPSASGFQFALMGIMERAVSEIQGHRYEHRVHNQSLKEEIQQLQNEVRNLPAQLALHLRHAPEATAAPELTGRSRMELIGSYISLLRIALPYVLLVTFVAGKLTHHDTLPLLREMLGLVIPALGGSAG